MPSDTASVISSSAVNSVVPHGLHLPSDVQDELRLVRRLQQLAKVSWSPTLRANAEALRSRASELKRVAARAAK